MEAMVPQDTLSKIDLDTLTVADVDRMLSENEETRKRLLAVRKHLVVVAQAKAALAASLDGAIGGKVIPLASARSRRASVAAPDVEPGAPTPGSPDAQVFDALCPMPLTVEKLAQMVRAPEKNIAERLEDLEHRKLVGHFDIEKRKPSKHKGVSTPVIDRFYFWRPRSELSSKVRRTIFKGLLTRQWMSNHDLVLAAGARSATEKRDVDNMLRAIRRAENVWHKRNEMGDWLYWMSPDGAEPPDELDGRDWNPRKSIHGRRDPKRAAQKLKAAAAAGRAQDSDDEDDDD